MDSNSLIANISTSVILVLRRYVLLIITPYKTMRKIAAERDRTQIIILFFLIFCYFLVAHQVKEYDTLPILIFLNFLFNFSLTVAFLYIFCRVVHRRADMRAFVFTLAYSLIPTITWFIVNTIFYIILPPPRTLSVAGKLFTIFFLSFSISLLAWKLILFYLAIRFSSGMKFSRIIYLIILYLCVVFPYSILLYHFKLFRVPFL